MSDAMPVALLLLLIGLCALPSRARSAAMPYRVMDIRPGPDGSSPGSLTGIGEALYFSADDGEHGLEVWRSDGTAAGTVMLGDMSPGRLGTELESFTQVGSRVFFVADESVVGVIDGAPETARLIAASLPYDSPEHLTASRDRCYFAAEDATGQREIFVTDGASVALAVDLASDSPSRPADLVDFDGTLVFAADTPEFGREMWKHDGARSFLVKDIFPGFNASGPNSSFPVELTRFGDQILFSANDGLHGAELWTTDLTSTRLLANLRADFFGQPASSAPRLFTAVGDRAYFEADTQDGKPHLYVTDGTETGTVLLPTPASASGRIAALEGDVYFGAEVDPDVWGLWVTNGTPAGTRLLKRFAPRHPELLWVTGPLLIAPFAAAGPFAYFFVLDRTADTSLQLWRTDGTEAGTTMVSGLDQRIFRAAAAGDAMFFTAEDEEAGLELWAITACGDGVVGTAEECDDGNTEAGDCCTPSCRLSAPAPICDDGNACTTGDVCRAGACTGSAVPGCGCGNVALDGAADVGCDDGNACTIDGCDAATGCLHERVGFGGAQASLSAGIAATPCGPEPAMRRVRRHLGKAERLVGRAERASTRKTPKLLRRGLARLRKGARVLGRAAELTPSCAAGLAARFDEAIARVTCLLDERRQAGR